jgi:hypothetical protein
MGLVFYSDSHVFWITGLIVHDIVTCCRLFIQIKLILIIILNLGYALEMNAVNFLACLQCMLPGYHQQIYNTATMLFHLCVLCSTFFFCKILYFGLPFFVHICF